MDRCNMSCNYCYIPFINEKINFSLMKKIIYKCSEIGIQIITFGGGDPYNYVEFRNIIDIAYSLNIQIHIDTNGINLTSADYEQINQKVSILSFPIDGPTPYLHNYIRNYNGNHLEKIRNHLYALSDSKAKLKINTIVSKKNIDLIEDIYQSICYLNISTWSLYQFWPLHNAQFYKNDFFITELEFNNSISKIDILKPAFFIEKNTINKRCFESIFLSPNGKIYIHNKYDPNYYTFLGDFLNEDITNSLDLNRLINTRIDTKHRYNL
ncbi:radical SAM protein [Bacteroides fragilis]|nr:radical SAM protein [Bacteroides fragilis]MCZ2501379.1 radical SAM protein [Bacteroides fragilis]